MLFKKKDRDSQQTRKNENNSDHDLIHIVVTKNMVTSDISIDYLISSLFSSDNNNVLEWNNFIKYSNDNDDIARKTTIHS